MASAMTLDLEPLLAPISTANPAGQDLSYTVVGELKNDRTLRPEFDDPEPIQWPKIIEKAGAALRDKTKDLRIAGYLTEALVKQHGFAGLSEGLSLIQGLLENYWERLYPAINEGSVKARIQHLEWLDRELATAVKQIPITSDPGGESYTFLQWEESKQFDIPENLDDLVHTERDRFIEMRERAVRDKKTTSEQWRKAKKATPPEFYFAIAKSLDESWTGLQALLLTMQAKFTRVVPGLESLQEALEQEFPNAGTIRAAFVEAQPIIEAKEELDVFKEELENLLKQPALAFDEVNRLRGKLFLHEAPSLASLTKSLDEVRRQINKFVAELPPQPESPELPIGGAPITGGTPMMQLNQPFVSFPTQPIAGARKISSTGIGSREEALGLLTAVARYFHETEPHSPVAPLVERAIKWGRMELVDWLKDVLKDESSALNRLHETLGIKSEK